MKAYVIWFALGSLALQPPGSREPVATLDRWEAEYLVCKKEGRWEEAEIALRRLQTLQQRALPADDPRHALIQGRLAYVVIQLGRLGEAEAIARAALAARGGELGRETIKEWGYLQSSLAGQGKSYEAEQIGRALLAWHQQSDPEGTAKVALNLGGILDNQGRYHDALPLYRLADPLKDSPLRQEWAVNRARNAIGRGQADEAEALLRAALADKAAPPADPRSVAIPINLAWSLRQRGEPAEAARVLRTTLGQADGRTSLFVLNRLASALIEAEDWAEAETCLRRAADLPEIAEHEAARLQADLARVLRRTGRRREALQRAALAALHFERARAIAAAPGLDRLPLGDQLSPYDLLADLRLEAGDPEGAWKAWDAARGRCLLDLGGKGVAVPVAEVAAALPRDGALVGWLQTPDGPPKAVVLRPGEPPRWFDLPGSGPDGDWTEVQHAQIPRARAALTPAADGRVSPDWATEINWAAWRWLAPLNEALEGVRTLVAVPSPGLEPVPIEVLLAAPCWSGPEPVVTYVPSASWYARARPAGPLDRLVVAAQAADLAGLGPLPFAEVEARALAEGADPARSKVLIGPDASERLLDAAVRELRPGWLHIASHATIDASRPDGAALLLRELAAGPGLGPGPPFDGALTVREVVETWRLPDGSLVVLGGCGTATGAASRGEGQAVLARAFLIANARDVVASRWPVSDHASALLLTRFAARLRAGEGRAAALQQAREWLRGLDGSAAARALADLGQPPDGPMPNHPFEHPFFWAGFVLIGPG